MIVKKYRTISIFEIGKTESYLSDMAKEGLFLIGMTQSRNIFQKKEPNDIEYRMEFEKGVLNPQRKEMYETHGWRHTCSFKGIHVFQAPAQDGLVEIHTDPQEQSYTLRQSCKKLIGLICFEAVMLLCIIPLTILATQIGGTPILNLLQSNFTNMINLTVFTIVVIEIIKQSIIVMQIKKRLQMGFYIDHHEPWKKRQVSQYIMYGILTVAIIIIFAGIGYNTRNIVGYLSGATDYTLTQNTVVPVVRLNEIEKLKTPVMRTYNSDRGRKKQISNVSTSYHLFMNKKEVHEEFYQADMTWQGDVYTPSIQTRYYKILIPFMIQGALGEIINQSKEYFDLTGENISVEKLIYKGLDEVYYIPTIEDSKHYFGLVVRKDNTILWMIYCGRKTRSEVLEATQALFE